MPQHEWPPEVPQPLAALPSAVPELQYLGPFGLKIDATPGSGDLKEGQKGQIYCGSARIKSQSH
jgi:hypothetical protein